MLRYSACLLILLSTCVFAQNFQYELKGNYQLDSSSKQQIHYTLQWSENKNGNIEGLYRDNFFGDHSKVHGEVTDAGRTFEVEFSGIKNGIHSLVILSSVAKIDQSGTQLPVSVITRDVAGNPVTTIKTSSQFFQRSNFQLAQRQEENCIEGFGVLAGFCGIYSGMIAEEVDRKNKCNLLFADAARLEVRPDATVLLYLGQPNGLVESSYHTLGRLPSDPQKDSIDILNRVCGKLVGVNSSVDTCKVLHLTGRFTTQNDNKHFTGTYEINEEGKNATCRYGLSMDKQFAP